jgi:bifunctional DNase/RNase
LNFLLKGDFFMMFKMYLEAVKWDGEEAPCMLIFSNAKDGGKLDVEIPEVIGFDLRTLLNQKLDGLTPYFGITELIPQLGGKIEKLIIRSSQKPGTATVLVEIGGKAREVELFFADVVSIAIIENMPIYFDESVCQKNELPLDRRLFFTRTSALTRYSFDTDM